MVLTGPKHSGTQLHGFLSYLMKCAINHTPYTIFGYKGKQVRDNIHSDDLVAMSMHSAGHPGALRFTMPEAAASPIVPCSKPLRCARRSRATR